MQAAAACSVVIPKPDECARTQKESDHVHIAVLRRHVQNVAPAAMVCECIAGAHARIPVVVHAKRDPQQQGRGPSAALAHLLAQQPVKVVGRVVLL